MFSQSSSDNPKKGFRSFFFLAFVSASAILFFMSPKGSILRPAIPQDPNAAVGEIDRDELSSLYEKLNQQKEKLTQQEEKLSEMDWELEKKDQELEELVDLFQASIERSQNSSSVVEKSLIDVLGFPLDPSKERNLAPLEINTKRNKKEKKLKKTPPVVQKQTRSLYFERKCKPADMYQNYNDVYTPSVLAPTLDWNFNRGLSTSSKALGNSRFPTMLSVFNEPSKKIFATAQLEINATTVSDIENGDPIQYLQYDGSNLANQDTSSETTAITNLMEYTQDADTQIYYPIDDGNSYIYSLVGLQNGQVNLCQVFMGSEVEWTTSCWFTIEDLGDAIADMLYIPQVNIVIMLTVKNVMVVYNVSWSNSVPTLTYFGQKNDLSECYDGSSADSEDKKESGCHELPSPRSLSGLFVDENNIFVYLCAPQGLLAFQLYTWGTNPLVNVQGSDNDWIGTDFCVQSVPTPYGLYLHNQMEVLFLPFVQYDPAKDSSIPPYAMFGNANPEIYLVYRRLTPTDDVGSSHSNDSGEDTFDLITSIAFSPNTNNVVSGRSHVTGNMQSFYEGGALVIATIRYDDTVVGTTKCLSGKFNKDDATPSYSSTCPGSIVLNDICAQGKNNEFINDLIDGPAYGLQVDNNMNILTQNGQGGISFFSVGYLPGMAQDGVFLANLVNPCSGSKIKTILAAVLAAAALIIGCVAFLPALAGTAAATALAATSLAAGTAGAVVPFV